LLGFRHQQDGADLIHFGSASVALAPNFAGRWRKKSSSYIRLHKERRRSLDLTKCNPNMFGANPSAAEQQTFGSMRSGADPGSDIQLVV
jgi:hypothetical protein